MNKHLTSCETIWDAVWKVISLKRDIVALFTQVLDPGFQPSTLPNLGQYLWRWQCECASITITLSPSAEDAQTICDAVWKVIQPQPQHSGIIFTHPWPRISANSPKSGQIFVVLAVWMCIHNPIHISRRCPNTLHMYGMDVGCSLKGYTSSTIA